MQNDATLTCERLRQVLDYDPGTGLFRWRVSLRKGFAGRIAGTTDTGGYIIIGIDGLRYFAHRLAWMFVHGAFPPDQIDHIDRNTGNNRIANLRPATGSQNLANMAMRITNTSGKKGATWHKRAGKYQSQIKVSGRCVYLGLFNDPESANAAYAAAAKHYYGEYARPDGRP